jgi:lipid A 3-O-deacylase
MNTTFLCFTLKNKPLYNVLTGSLVGKQVSLGFFPEAVLFARILFSACALSLFFAAPAHAKDPYSDIISELRIGFLSHDVKDFVVPFTSRDEDGLDLNGEVLFQSPGFLSFVGSPRPNLGVSINTAGDTSMAYAGMMWQYDFDFGLFAGMNLGFAVHNGTLDNYKLDPTHESVKRLGTRVLFHLAPEIGYRFESGYGVSLYWSHISNGQMLGSATNEGIDSVGVRFSYKLDDK